MDGNSNVQGWNVSFLGEGIGWVDGFWKISWCDLSVVGNLEKKKTRVFPEWHRQNVLNKKTKKPMGFSRRLTPVRSFPKRPLVNHQTPSKKPWIITFRTCNQNWSWKTPYGCFPPNHPVFVGFSIIFTIHLWGFSPYFWKHPYVLFLPSRLSKGFSLGYQSIDLIGDVKVLVVQAMVTDHGQVIFMAQDSWVNQRKNPWISCLVRSHVWSSSSYCQFNHLEHHKYLRIRSISPPLRIRYLWIRSLKAPHYLHVFHHVFFSPLTSHPILCNWMRFYWSSVMAAFSFSSLTCNAGIAWPRVQGADCNS